MEVHHHAHTSRKKWTHYFWEFIMLFLAVFCGFLAENKREHIVENHRAKEYAKILIEDLKNDTIELQTNLSDYRKIRSYIDSVHSMAMHYKDKDSLPASFYYYCRLATTSISTTWHNSTLRQLINSGNARYFKNQKLLALLSEYDMKSSHISSQQDNDKHFRNIAMELRSRVLDATFFGSFAGIRMENDSIKMREMFNTRFLPTFNNNSAIMNEFLNSLHNRMATLSYLNELNLPRSLRTAIELIEILKVEYHIK